jgi:PAS domain S-box-containing protein
MAIHHKGPHDWTDEEQGLLAQVVERSWAHIERVRGAAMLHRQEEMLRLATEAAAIGSWDFNPKTGKLTWDARCKELFGLPPDAEVTYEDTFVAGLNPLDRDRTLAAIEDALRPGGPGTYDVEYRTIGLRDGRERWIAATGRGIFRDGEAVRFVGTVQDITPRKRAELALAEETRALDLLNGTANRLAGELDLNRLVQAVVDAGVAFCGAQFGAFFYNVANEKGESYMLYALSGADPAHFNKFPMPRNTAVFAPTFAGEGIVRSGDITKDPRYGHNAPRKGMPEGHLPVRSYLAVPVMSRTGEVLGGLFFGHGLPDVFDARSERLMTGLAAQAAIAIDNAHLFQGAQRLNQTLESRVEERSAALLKAQAALQQAQKMEAIGNLTGGVAHDFNNLLAAVLGSLQLLQKRTSDPGQVRLIENAMQAAQRGAMLTRRMLAFARKQDLKSEAVRVPSLVEGMRELLESVLGPTIRIQTALPASLPLVQIDANQLETALLNLAVNARDAMNGNGRITIAAGHEVLGMPAHGLAPGAYVRLSVTDEGAGMDEATLKRAIEPFFTTKGIGQGTGLGLSMVLGFAQQSGGTLILSSAPGQGTTAEIWLPVAAALEETGAPGETVAAAPAPAARLSILLVDDDSLVLRATCEMLEDLGHTVEAVSSAAAALDMLAKRPFDLVVSDHAMPNMTGAQLCHEIAGRHAGTRCLLISGYAELPADIPASRLAKPFDQEALARAVQAAASGA